MIILAATLLAALARGQTSVTPVPPDIGGPEPGQLATPDQLAPGAVDAAPVQPPGAQDLPSIGLGQLQSPAAPSVFEQVHTATDFGPRSAPDASTPGAWEPVRGPHTSLPQLRRGLDDLEARRAAMRRVIESQFRQRREALQADENFRGLPWARRREVLGALSAGRDAQLRAIDDAAGRYREAIKRRIKEKSS